MASAAALWRPERLTAKLTPDRATAMAGIGFGSLLGLAYFFVYVSELNEWLYRGGFLVLSLLTAALIAIAAHPGLKFGQVLGNPILKWFGDRSYGIYLWHWPILIIAKNYFPSFEIRHTALVLSLTLSFSAVTHKFFERPIRQNQTLIQKPRVTIFSGVMLLIITAIAMRSL